MYRARSRRNNDGSGVRGPNSALTQFLKEQGISAENIRDRWLEAQKKEAEHPQETQKDDSETESDEDLKAGVAAKKRSRKPRAVKKQESSSSGESDDDEDDDDEDDDDYKAEARLRRLRGADLEDSDEEEEVLPVSDRKKRMLTLTNGKKTSPQLAKARHQQKKTRRKKAANLLDKKDSLISSLQDICIKVIGKSIVEYNAQSMVEHIRDTLGGVSLENLNKLAQALTKNRALNDDTLQLFLNTSLTTLTFYDCSKLSYEGYKRLAIFSPHLESLSLQMCGQLNNEALLYLAEKLPNLKELYLDGPFLINEDTWVQFFELLKGRLTAFHVSNTHRFNDNALSAMLRNCGSSLESLGLATLDTVTNYALLPQYLNSPNFHTLILEEPSRETDINDEVIISLLGSIGQNLRKLSLNRCTGLTDSCIINGFLPFLSNSGQSILTDLELEELDQITTDGIVLLFSSLQFPLLKRCSLKRCFALEDAAVVELLLNSSSTLEELNLNGLKSLTSKTFTFMACPNLKQLNIGFVHCVDNEIVEKISKDNEKLTIIEVYGDNQVTGKCSPRNGVSIIGRQSDSI
ncbi:UV-damaged DNA-binding protein RAD7 [Kluyveromyces lactis]|uniref:KLLA0A07997p n=1 Tax=Kluyveromyces lactis (strain ATCC 8585 / CBS 2359 / DSM 70799 / NBRC 1267 / NRRL Y-1140 / WM37) TaxID=284590 RepID=Q6CXI3_KLULA|nr:uncharacterized protein KLLA0_A07997g [Kluyveromyces lactis]CAH02944.1 KLLA0A07997p [Kluyveromyces lactis]|eukprot:XP_451356.1 uncharacterized protein KLLA0_A07997g [Kluyveromyces lactis]